MRVRDSALLTLQAAVRDPVLVELLAAVGAA